MLTIYEYTHGLYVTGFSNDREVDVISSVASRYKETRRVVKGRKVFFEIAHYYTMTNINYTKKISEYFFTFLQSRKAEVLAALNQVGILYEIKSIEPYDPDKDYRSKDISFKVIGKSLWEEQEDYVKYIQEPGHRKLIPAQTGFGKGTVLSFSLSGLGGRSFFQIKKGYLVKLKAELLEDTDLKGDDIVIIKSTKELYKYVDRAVANKSLPKIIMCPMGMLNNYANDWKMGVHGWDFDSPYNPIHLFTILKIKNRVIDETHEWFDKIYFIDTLTNVDKAIYLSGTFDADKERNSLRYNLQIQLIPLDERPPVPVIVPFGTFVKQSLSLPNLENIIQSAEACIHGYSHIKYEQGILSRTILYEMYFRGLGDLFEKYFVNWIRPEDGERPRALFLFVLKETCTLFTAYMRKRFPKLDINRYIADDDNSILENSKIIISTVKSCGTAVDIKGITFCLNTFVTKKKELIIQMRGRNRNPQKKGLLTESVYILSYNNNSKWHNEAVAANDYYLKKYMTTIFDGIPMKMTFK